MEWVIVSGAAGVIIGAAVGFYNGYDKAQADIIAKVERIMEKNAGM